MACFSCLAGRYDHPGQCQGQCPFCGGGPDKPVKAAPFLQVHCAVCKRMIEQRLVAAPRRVVPS